MVAECKFPAQCGELWQAFPFVRISYVRYDEGALRVLCNGTQVMSSMMGTTSSFNLNGMTLPGVMWRETH